MTVAQLKRHIDRRLRTKADKKDVRRLEARMDARFTRVDARFTNVDRRFNRLETILARIERKLDDVERNTKHHAAVLDEHEKRLAEIEGRRTA